MTTPKDPANSRPKSCNSSRASMDIADKIMKEELVANGDGRWHYKPTKDGARQHDIDIAMRAGCNESYVSKERRRIYGPLVPKQSEEARAAKRGKRPPGFVYPNASAPEPAVIDRELMDRGAAITKELFGNLWEAIRLLTAEISTQRRELAPLKADLAALVQTLTATTPQS